MIESGKGHLAPVYAPIAKQIVSDFDLSEKEGIGIDLGSGPGTLILELCKLTKNLHWINADINPHFFPRFFAEAEKAGMSGRVSAMFADAHALPFRDGYADAIVSRGCFFFWENKPQALAEVYRVLKPGGAAFVGRGMARHFPVDKAREIRSHQKGSKVLFVRPSRDGQRTGRSTSCSRDCRFRDRMSQTRGRGRYPLRSVGDHPEALESLRGRELHI